MNDSTICCLWMLGNGVYLSVDAHLCPCEAPHGLPPHLAVPLAWESVLQHGVQWPAPEVGQDVLEKREGRQLGRSQFGWHSSASRAARECPGQRLAVLLQAAVERAEFLLSWAISWGHC